MRKLIAMIAAAVATSATLPAATINLANVTSNTTLNDGDVATGTLGGNYKISIAAGATVTLSNAAINGVSSEGCLWAGLNCLGDATIILVGSNTVKGFNLRYPGIHVPEEKTLTITGNGSLHASSNDAGSGIGGGNDVSCGNIVINGGDITTIGGDYNSGIGAGWHTTCGNITINGGTIVATGGVHSGPGDPYGAGIGGGESCGNITINGGTITATGVSAAGIGGKDNGVCGDITINGGTIVATATRYAAGIGGAYYGKCGNITVNSGVTSVTATCGNFCSNPIGAGGGSKSSCGTVTVIGVTDTVDGKTRTITGTGEGPATGWNGNLATLTEDTTIEGMMVVYGQLSTPCKVSVADGAMVVLNNATIIGENDDAYDWAGITCLGDATIVLNGENTVTGFYEGYPGIFVHEGKTLTIRGNGSLAASGNDYGAGIGGGYEVDCGNIVIESGTITADGGRTAAGIGGGYAASCGDITISGGTVIANGGGRAAGIGGGKAGSCGDVAIGSGIVRVTATCGDDCDNPIGAGLDGTSGTVTVPGSLSDLTFGHKRVIAAATVANDLTLADGDVATGRVVGNYRISIADGATVTISNLVVNGSNSTDCAWAGLTCLGDATVILKGENSVRGFHEDYPGLYVPVDKTLTIRGSGSLAASSNGSGAGIGGGLWIDCGSIVIAEGTVTATGGTHAAGIGGGDRSACGDIAITGGTVVATGGTNAAGIGGGDAGAGSSSCGDITVGPGITSVTTTSNTNPIGAGRGDGATCGAIAISDELRSVTDGLGTVTITSRVIHLDMLTGDRTAVDGDILTGTLGENCMVSVANGATVTLRDAAIIGENDGIYDWAGLTCLGDATIILEGENAVKGFYEDYPGIYVPANKTLTIRGGGSLAASSNGYGAGIGGGHWIDCGNIVIEGGAITADGGGSAAGIGGGYAASCGDITISGGTVIANGGGRAAGIGGGKAGSCGDVAIGSGIVRVTATCGDDCDNPIGAGLDGESGDVVLAAGLNDNTSGSTRTIEPWPIIDLATVAVDTTIADGYMVVGSHSGTNKITIADGATVILRDVSINPDGHNYNYPSAPWAGITCLGDATIILEGDNTVKGCNEYWPGVYVPEYKTLTITGDGALAAAGSGFYGAGIGGGFGQYSKGGSIVINGGVITATGGLFGAGIGSSGSNSSMEASSCMYITINGGSVTATGGAGAAGIGGGNDGDFWGITINGGSVTATGGAGAAGIGGGSCYANGGFGDDILIAGGTVTATGGANAAGIGTGENGYCISITIGSEITRVIATCGEGCENPIGAGVDGDCENEPDVASSLSDETSVDGRTRVLARQAISGYDAWAEENGLSGAWDATDANGIHNVFRYAFDKPTGDFALLGIEFNDAGKAVVVTPPLVNGEGFALSILATDRCDGEGAAATSYPLDPSGKTTIDETVSGSRFFRLKAQEE